MFKNKNFLFKILNIFFKKSKIPKISFISS